MPQKARDVQAALKSKGFQESTKKNRDHEYFFLYYNGKKTNIFTKISHGESEIHDKNCSLMAKQMKLSNSQFRDFVDCGLKLHEYLALLLQAKYLEQSPHS